MIKEKYSRKQILANINLIRKGKEQDVNIPLRVLKTTYPELYDKATRRLYSKIYVKRPENKEKIKLYFGMYNKKPEVKEKLKLYQQTEKYKLNRQKYIQKPSVKKKKKIQKNI